MRLHHVQVSCPPGGEDAARAFYGDLLGLTEVAKPELLRARGGVWFREPGLEVHIGVDDEFVAARTAHQAIAVADVDALAARIAEAGHEVAWDDRIPGLRRFHTRDGHGNRVELQQDGDA